MWMFKFVPDVFYYAVFFSGFTGFFLTLMLTKLPHRNEIKILSVVVALVGIFLLGMMKANSWWTHQAEALEQKIVALELASQNTNTNIKEKLVSKNQTIKLQSEDVIKYIDREVVKYDTTCVIPTEFVTSINKAVK